MAVNQQLNAGVITEPTLVAGNLVQIDTDLIQIDTYVHQKSEFYEPNLTAFNRDNFVRPKITNQLIDIAREKRLLVLGGSTDIDKSALARHIASSLIEELQRGSDHDESNLAVLEWNRNSSDLQDIRIKLQETETKTIFILPRISPQDIGYDLRHIKKAADENEHLVLVSTDIPLIKWKLSDDYEKSFWQELTPTDRYDIEDLKRVLEKEQDDQPLVEEEKIAYFAEQLKTPENISIFVRLLRAETPPVQPEIIDKLIEDIHNNNYNNALAKWYNTVLSQREQLLALGLSFFEGLFDDQFFAAMDRVVEDAWQRRDKSLIALDYCDLENLYTFFRIVEVEGDGGRIESRIKGQRRMLFDVALKNHRRQILAALPVMAQLAADSVLGRKFDLELYNTWERRSQLRNAISSAISDIGLISVGAVQSTILQLAADDDLAVQLVPFQRDFSRK